MTRENFEGQGAGFVSQWAFPQAYYSTFNSTLASFASSGLTQRTHTGVRKQVAEQAACGALPNDLNIYADGSDRCCVVHGIEANDPEYKSAVLDENNPENLKEHIISYFRSTRRMHLDDKKGDLKIKNSLGKIKQRLNAEDWQKVSNATGKTSWLCLLYRKRIKSNYKDIGTFLSPDFDTTRVLTALTRFVWVFNFANEINVVNHLGADVVNSWIPDGNYQCNERLALIRDEVIT
jgi:hypothetical protein